MKITPFKCPLCGQSYNGNCSNKDCSLYHEIVRDHWKVGKYVLRKVNYHLHYPLDCPKSFYYWFRNRFIHRYDLIRTGLPKSTWLDKDGLIEEGLMGMLVDYVEQEQPWGIVNWLEYKDIDRDKDDYSYEMNKKIIDLYIDIKVSLPKLRKELIEMEDKLPEIHMVDGPHVTSVSRRMFLVQGGSKEDNKLMGIKIDNAEKAVTDLITDILVRIVRIRGYLWT